MSSGTLESQGFLLTKVEDLINWGRKNSTWYLLFGTACCAIELMQTGGPRGDLERFGSAPRASPRQADLIIVAGTITYKMATRVKMLYDQMPEPKYVISMGSCSNCGGLFQLAYSVLKGIDQVIPVDVYVPGCPPRPEALIEGLLHIQKKMEQERGWLTRRLKGGRRALAGEADTGGAADAAVEADA
ncbi:MAG: NADH-quinone oxidoreductase subunit B [Deltaproteobacteria bacterium]|nr:MAG: NADH-quinone oxidoreductase subunit B [Deltaproteobacteria bacterium]